MKKLFIPPLNQIPLETMIQLILQHTEKQTLLETELLQIIVQVLHHQMEHPPFPKDLANRGKGHDPRFRIKRPHEGHDALAIQSKALSSPTTIKLVTVERQLFRYQVLF